MIMYALKLNEKQAQVLVDALDLYTRIGLGQFEEVAQVYGYNLKLQESKHSALRSLMMVAKEVVGHHPSSSFGIHNEKVDDIFRVAYDIKQVVRNRLAWDRNPQGDITVAFDPPRPISEQPLAQIGKESPDQIERLRKMIETATKKSVSSQARDHSKALLALTMEYAKFCSGEKE